MRKVGVGERGRSKYEIVEEICELALSLDQIRPQYMNNYHGFPYGASTELPDKDDFCLGLYNAIFATLS